MGVLGTVICCILSALAGMCITIIVGGVTALHRIKNDIEDLKDKSEKNNRE